MMAKAIAKRKRRGERSNAVNGSVLTAEPNLRAENRRALRRLR